MFIDRKYITIITGEHHIGHDESPLLYIDGFKHTASLTKNCVDNDSIYIDIGILGFHLSITVKWNFIEREMTTEEKVNNDTFKKLLCLMGDE